jgi:hypothetical protein
MESFIRALLADLERACTLICRRLAASDVAAEVSAHAVTAYREAERIRRAVAVLRADPSLGTPALLPAHLRQYRRWHASLSLIESYPLLFIERFDESDRRLTRLAAALAREIAWPLPAPLVAAMSIQYYWTEPNFNVICVPVTEGASLLNLPDMLHEMGHNLFAHHELDLAGSFVGEIATYITSEKQRVQLQQRPPEYFQLYDRLFDQWREPWLREFVADMVATYIGGPPFGYQHIKLCAGIDRPAYHPSLGDGAEHPADEARLGGIVAVLETINCSDAAQEVATLWGRYVTSTAELRAPDYDVCYPQHLISALAHHVVRGCQALGIRGLDAVVSQPDDIITLIHDSWYRYRVNPDDHAAWEEARLAEMWVALGE